MNPLVSICIPTYNRAGTFLPQALSAALGQTYRNLELLVSDNASTDGTPELMRGIHDPRVRYCRQEKNLGSVGNIDFCIQASRGAYTLLLMDDDSIDPDFVEACIAAARKDPDAGLVRTGARIVDEGNNVTHRMPNLAAGLDFTEFVLAWIEGRTAPFLCSTLFRTVALQEIGIRSRHRRWDDVMGEFEIAFRHGRIDIPDIKASYCIHPGELTFKEGIQEWCEDSLDLIDLVCRLVPQDAAVLRARLTPYMATLNYRFAAHLEAPWTTRLSSALDVYRAFHILPKLEFFRDFVAPMPWFGVLRSIKRLIRQKRVEAD